MYREPALLPIGRSSFASQIEISSSTSGRRMRSSAIVNGFTSRICRGHVQQPDGREHQITRKPRTLKRRAAHTRFRSRVVQCLLKTGFQADARAASVLNSPEKFDDSNSKRLRDQVETCQGHIHLAALERAHLGAMEPAFVRENVLGPALLQS
jgi:hypothetical protein